MLLGEEGTPYYQARPPGVVHLQFKLSVSPPGRRAGKGKALYLLRMGVGGWPGLQTVNQDDPLPLLVSVKRSFLFLTGEPHVNMQLKSSCHFIEISALAPLIVRRGRPQKIEAS